MPGRTICRRHVAEGKILAQQCAGDVVVFASPNGDGGFFNVVEFALRHSVTTGCPV